MSRTKSSVSYGGLPEPVFQKAPISIFKVLNQDGSKIFLLIQSIVRPFISLLLPDLSPTLWIPLINITYVQMLNRAEAT